MTDRHIDSETGTETTGHEWDGIRELNNPLPRWWLWSLYGTVVWGVIYTILFPAWPLVSGATDGLLGWSSREEVAQEMAAVDASQEEFWSSLRETDLQVIAENEALERFATQAGAALFRNNCSQCHGSGAAGAVGYPNLLDDAWLWGGQVEEIAYTIRHGIRNDDDPEARFSQMPGFGDLLSREEIRTLVAHVQSLDEGGDPLAGPGGELFSSYCASCHGEDARGDRTMGAPNLTDAIWLFGDSDERLFRTISEGPFGVMPAWGQRLDEAEVRALATYVHGLGGGEDAPAEAQVGEGGAATDPASEEPVATIEESPTE